jgi:hypothetical protein
MEITPFVSTALPEDEHSVRRRKSVPDHAGKTEMTHRPLHSSSVFFLKPILYNSSRSVVTMKGIQAGGVLLLAVDLAFHAGYHLEVASYHGAPPSADPFDVVATATAQPVFFTGNNYLSRIPT